MRINFKVGSWKSRWYVFPGRKSTPIEEVGKPDGDDLYYIESRSGGELVVRAYRRSGEQDYKYILYTVQDGLKKFENPDGIGADALSEWARVNNIDVTRLLAETSLN